MYTARDTARKNELKEEIQSALFSFYIPFDIALLAH
jgi:hypothetical protein